MSSRINENLMKAMLFILLCVVLLLRSFFADAQTHKGFDVAFGAQLATINSDIEKINLKQLHQMGGSIGFLYGNNKIASQVSGGYYSSTQSCPGTVDRYMLAARVKVFPLSWLSNKSRLVNPYIVTGVSYDNLRLYGYYINREPGVTNWSQAEAPYLGSIKQVNAGVGGGLSFAILQQFDFIRLYSEVWYGNNLSARASDQAFNNTTLKNQMQINLGLTFGAVR